MRSTHTCPFDFIKFPRLQHWQARGFFFILLGYVTENG